MWFVVLQSQSRPGLGAVCVEWHLLLLCKTLVFVVSTQMFRRNQGGDEDSEDLPPLEVSTMSELRCECDPNPVSAPWFSSLELPYNLSGLRVRASRCCCLRVCMCNETSGGRRLSHPEEWVRRRKESITAELMQRCFRRRRSREGYLPPKPVSSNSGWGINQSSKGGSRRSFLPHQWAFPSTHCRVRRGVMPTSHP